LYDKNLTNDQRKQLIGEGLDVDPSNTEIIKKLRFYQANLSFKLAKFRDAVVDCTEA
jgi:hypothetical protein